jgi:pimeloyl-ACP methyl ester carboxylesterase
MSLVQNIKYFPSKSPHKEAIVLCGFGGAIWQTKRLTNKLNRAGYNVTALDFPTTVLSTGDPNLLPQMIDEVVEFVEAKAKQTDQKILLVGISLGSLLSLNIFRRSKLFDTAVMVTGGNIVTVAHNIYGRKIWPQSHDELSKLWQGINIHTEPKRLAGKKALFVLPSRDRLIDTSEVLAEIDRQNRAGNTVKLVKRMPFGHVGTIIQETIIFPGRILQYINQLEAEATDGTDKPSKSKQTAAP